MLQSVQNQTANQAYKKYVNAFHVNADADSQPISFKDWLAEQKANGNIAENGKLILDKFFGKTNTTPDKTKDLVKDKTDDKKELKILGMKPIVAIPVIIGVGVAIYFTFRYFKNKNK